MENSSDPFNLARFVQAQQDVYESARAELAAGRKRSHWMWFVFPQLKGLGFSPTAQHYGIGSLEEARAYLAHPLLGERLRECCRLLAQLDGHSAGEIFGYPDELKLRSCLTLFAQAAPQETVFAQCLEKYFAGQGDPATLQLLR